MQNDYNLLPFIREDIYGLNKSFAQIIGWEINLLGVQKTWKMSQGEGVVTAVIDTGCDIYHNDIKDNIIDGINLLSNNNYPIDDNGHGTHVCGTIAAKNNALGIVGVAPSSKIIPIKALDGNGSGNNKNIAKGIVMAADRSCDFITMSLGSPNISSDIEKSLKYATNKGCVVFCAAGNSGENMPIMYPASSQYTIAIGSINRNFNRSHFTCRGEELDFLSPGEDILGCVPDNNYAVMSGTSMANPFSVGCAALLLSYAKKNKIEYKLKTNYDYIEILRKSVRHLTNDEYRYKKEYEGHGILLPPDLYNL